MICRRLWYLEMGWIDWIFVSSKYQCQLYYIIIKDNLLVKEIISHNLSLIIDFKESS
jgi:hypothetical protein